MFAPLTIADVLKLLWWGITHTAPKIENSNTAPSRSLYELKADADRLERPLVVVAASDHSFREAKFHSTTAILCEERGRRTLHEDHFPDEPPGKGFDATETTKFTRVKVLLVQ